MGEVEELQKLIQDGKNIGFSQVARLDPQRIEALQDVRDMCAKNTCHMYNARWSCPPACGEIEECEKQMKQYHTGLLVQTMGELEDSMDYEGMVELEEKHKKYFHEFYDELKEKYPNCLALGTGCCTRCKECTYPDAPCRFPDKMVSSMEAYGILVSQVCKDHDVPYYYGPNTLAYTACYLLD